MSRLIRQLLKIGRTNGWRNDDLLLTRRDAIRLGLIGAAAIALPAPPPALARHFRPQAAQRPTRVAIVGGGFAGLACADALLAAGADPHVFEAESRVGGRVLTDRKFIDGDTVELGGEFVGDNHPTWLALAKKYEIDLAELPEVEGDEAFILEGKLLRGEELEKVYGEVEEVIAKLIELAKDIDPEKPWTAANAAELDGQSVLEWFNSTQMGEQARAMMIAESEADNGVPAGRMSMLALLAMIKGGGLADYFELSETRRVNGGNDTLATAIARKLGDRVKLRTPVAKVERTKDGVKLTTGDGATVEADAVVLAIPPTQWEKVQMTPAMDSSLKPQFGVNTKLIVRIDTRVFGDLSSDVAGDGLVQYGWISGEAGGAGISYTMFSGAESAKQIRELSGEDRTKKACASLAPAYPDLAGAVKKDMFVDWPGMPRVRGSYSFPAPGEVTRFGQTLAEGVKDELAPLLFAGEHTSSAFAGYMEGALASGVRAANTIVSRVGAMKRA
jgi:monoamine oxidase